jgi:hypothetical protein
MAINGDGACVPAVGGCVEALGRAPRTRVEPLRKEAGELVAILTVSVKRLREPS